MHVTAANMAALLVAYSTAFRNGLQTPPPIDFVALGAAMSVPSSTLTNAYPFNEAFRGFQEWLGDRVFQDVMAHMHEIKNRDFEMSRKVKVSVLEDDQQGLIAPWLQADGSEWPTLQYELFIEVLTNQVKTFDGKAVFADDHPAGIYSATLDNLVTDALSKTSFEAAILAAAAWKFSNDKPTRTTFTHLFFGPKLQATVFDLIDNQYVVGTAATGGTADYVGGQIMNRNFKRVTPVLVPDFIGTYDDYWVLADCSKGIKPFLLQLRKTPVFTMDTDPTQIEMSGEIRMGASGRAAAGATFPHLSYGGVL